jgi:prepilin-type N-terminal cleavage/methylation domain-containing protein
VFDGRCRCCGCPRWWDGTDAARARGFTLVELLVALFALALLAR